MGNLNNSTLRIAVIIASVALLFFIIPHSLEDFAVGEPARAGIPAPALSMVVSTMVAIQALGLFWIGQGKKRGYGAHLIIAVFWPAASGFAQLPTILGADVYRSGFISVFYVLGIIGAGLVLLTLTLLALRRNSK